MTLEFVGLKTGIFKLPSKMLTILLEKGERKWRQSLKGRNLDEESLKEGGWKLKVYRCEKLDHKSDEWIDDNREASVSSFPRRLSPVFQFFLLLS